MKKQLNIKIEEEIYHKLRKYCKGDYIFQRKIYRVVERAIEEFIKNHDLKK